MLFVGVVVFFFFRGGRWKRFVSCHFEIATMRHMLQHLSRNHMVHVNSGVSLSLVVHRDVPYKSSPCHGADGFPGTNTKQLPPITQIMMYPFSLGKNGNVHVHRGEKSMNGIETYQRPFYVLL